MMKLSDDGVLEACRISRIGVVDATPKPWCMASNQSFLKSESRHRLLWACSGITMHHVQLWKPCCVLCDAFLCVSCPV